ncbi:MAG: SPFH domain-containing protein [Parcubacteria group bacterium]
MDTEEFYAKNRIPAKAFKIPHVKIDGSTGVGQFDYYGPAGRMYVVDRSAFNRRWTASSGTGTSPKDQSIHAQTKEGLNVTVETTISAKVLDKNAPKYLFWWGTDLQGNSADPKVIFASIIYARPLASVMDEVVLGEAHRLLFDKIAALSVDEVNTNAKKIMSETFAELKTFCAEGGIDLVSFGSAGTFTFDKDVQQALNDRYTAQVIAPYIGVLKEKAYIDAMNGWDHKLPTSLTMWSLAGLKDIFGGHDTVKPVEIPKVDAGKK